MKVRFNDRVVVIKGFYEGVVGHLYSYDNNTTYGIKTERDQSIIYVEMCSFAKLEEEE